MKSSPPAAPASAPDPAAKALPLAVPGQRWLRPFDSLRLASYRWFWLGVLASFTAIQVQEVARGWLVYDLTRSPLALGIVAASWGLPSLVFALFGGVMADRVDKRNLLLFTQSSLIVINLPIAILITLGHIQYWHLVVSGLLSGIAFAFNMPSRQAIIPELVGRQHLMNAISLNSAATNLTRFLGPALAGILIETVGVDMAYYATVAAYVVVVITTFMIPSTGVSARRQSSVWKDLCGGLRYVKQSQLLLLLMAMAFVPLLFGMAYRNLLPAFVVEVLGKQATELGLLMAATGAGALLGSLGMAVLGDYPRKGRLLLGAAMLFGVALVIFSLTTSYGLALFFMLAVGVGSSSFMTLNNTLVQTQASDEMRGRVMSIFMLTFGIQSLSTLPISALAEGIGVGWAMAAGGGLMVMFTLGVAVRFPQLRRI